MDVTGAHIPLQVTNMQMRSGENTVNRMIYVLYTCKYYTVRTTGN